MKKIDENILVKIDEHLSLRIFDIISMETVIDSEKKETYGVLILKSGRRSKYVTKEQYEKINSLIEGNIAKD